MAAAVCVAVGIAGPWWASLVAVIALVAVAVRDGVRLRGLMVLAVLVALGAAAGVVHTDRREANRDQAIPSGTGVVEISVREDRDARSGLAVGTVSSWRGVEWSGPRVAIDGDETTLVAGDSVVASGRFLPRDLRLRDEYLAVVFEIHRLDEVRPTTNPVVVLGNLVRGRVRTAFDSDLPEGALMIGLLVGDTEHLPSHDLEDLRRAGLAHYVAVSGSNVAVFLGAWWLIALPLAVRPWPRAVFGAVGLLVFVVATRWEPSVVRASVMAAIPLIGGPLGVSIDAWTALGTAATIVMLVSPGIVWSVGFQLSVLATAGVLLGVAMVAGRRPRWLWVSIGATVGAQAMVAPMIIAVFGSIPLVAPIANLIAGPLVGLATAVGMAATAIPVGGLGTLAEYIAAGVLVVAGVAADGPQLGATAAMGLGLGAAAVGWRRSRPVGVAGLLIAAAAIPGTVTPWPDDPRAVVLDVGQGDAILIQDPSGAAVLVDTGRDPGTIDRLLREYRVDRLSAIIATHGDSDHIGGLVEVLRSREVERIVISRHGLHDPGISDLVASARSLGVSVTMVSGGDRFQVGSIPVEVLGPSRRFGSDNDGSVVLLVGARRTMLLPGDIGGPAQAELPRITPEVVVVPHHGSSTTDLRWLAGTVRPGTLAVLSYGPNTYGHPHPDVVTTLMDAGATVMRTEDGHVEVPLG